ncbi:MAG: helix-turn-helix transcriptional regulator [Kiritimatiellae bacterium]|nr:helix-turn-helix transcriptional regulator [Kiritimatiellia bacterium]
MPNVAVVLRDEIARVARKEIRIQTEQIKKASAQHRRDIAALKRQVAQLERQIATLSKSTSKNCPISAATENEDANLRFNAKGLRSQRKRLGMSAAEYSKLVGVTAQSIYNWERGVARPRKGQIAILASLRNMGKKEAQARLK